MARLTKGKRRRGMKRIIRRKKKNIGKENDFYNEKANRGNGTEIVRGNPMVKVRRIRGNGTETVSGKYRVHDENDLYVSIGEIVLIENPKSEKKINLSKRKNSKKKKYSLKLYTSKNINKK